jgi:hypothetical protein
MGELDRADHHAGQELEENRDREGLAMLAGLGAF